MLKDLLSHGVDNPSTHVDHNNRKYIGKNGRNKIADYHEASVSQYKGKVHVSYTVDGINGFTG
jgi:hypothetical protein